MWLPGAMPIPVPGADLSQAQRPRTGRREWASQATTADLTEAGSTWPTPWWMGAAISGW